MRTIENHATHDFEFLRGPDLPHQIRIPRATEDRSHRPTVTVGVAFVDDHIVDEMQAHPIAKSWFGPDMLVVK